MFQQLPEVRSPWLMLAMCQHYARPACLTAGAVVATGPGLAHSQPRHVLAPGDRDVTGSRIVVRVGRGSDSLIHINRRE